MLDRALLREICIKAFIMGYLFKVRMLRRIKPTTTATYYAALRQKHWVEECFFYQPSHIFMQELGAYQALLDYLMLKMEEEDALEHRMGFEERAAASSDS